MGENKFKNSDNNCKALHKHTFKANFNSFRCVAESSWSNSNSISWSSSIRSDACFDFLIISITSVILSSDISLMAIVNSSCSSCVRGSSSTGGTTTGGEAGFGAGAGATCISGSGTVGALGCAFGGFFVFLGFLAGLPSLSPDETVEGALVVVEVVLSGVTNS